MADEMLPFVDRIIATGIDPLKVMVTWEGQTFLHEPPLCYVESITITDGSIPHRVTRKRIPKMAEILESSPGLFG